ncbi:hypothetical protein GCM10027612_10100 [Microbispora bryophytorum subsp. camponoti]
MLAQSHNGEGHPAYIPCRVLIADLGTASITWASLVLLVAACVTVIGGKKHAFPKGA